MNLTLSDLYYAWGEATALWFRAAPRRAMRLTAHGWLAASGEPYTDLNEVLIDAGSDAEGQLREFHQAMQARHLPAIYFFTPAVADQLAPTAGALGMTFAGKTPLMVCPVTSLPDLDAEPCTIKRVRTAAEQGLVCAILAHSFGMAHAALTAILDIAQLDAPGFTVYLAYQGEQAVSTVATTESGALVGIWAMATLPTYQRQGIGCALLGQVMAQQRDRGAKNFYLFSTDAGLRLYEQLGYRTVADLSVWTTGESVQVHG